MLRNAGDIAAADAIETDVCIVGAGPVGVTLALQLAHSKLRVLLVEAGDLEPEVRPAAFRGTTEGWSFPALEDTRSRGLGGTTTNWTARARWSPHSSMSCHPLDQVDFERRSWVPHSGWPFERPELMPYYARAQALCGIGPVEYDAELHPDDPAFRALAAKSSRAETTLMRFADPDWLAPHKAAVLDSERITLLLGAQAVEVETLEPGHVSALQLRTAGRSIKARAKAYVLAAGGIENARLLLLSDRTYPAGLGNGNDVVGRYFMDHLVLNHGTIVGADLMSHVELYRLHPVDGVPALGNLRLTQEVVRREQLLGALLWSFVGRRLFFSEAVRSFATLYGTLKAHRRPRRLGRTLGLMARDPISVAIASVLAVTGADLAAPRFFGLLPHLEQAPNPENRITLSAQQDAFGLRRPHLTWRVGDMERHSLQRTFEIVGEELKAEGRARLQHNLRDEDFHTLIHVAHHHMGTTRMHVDPKQGVVDPNCRVHRISNLYVAGTSVMPTSGAATVTLTAMALAIRLADHLQSRLEATPEEL